MLKAVIRNAGGYFTAVVAAYVLGAVFVSQGNIASIVALNFDITIAQRFDAAFHDVTHMTDIYLPIIAISYLIALPVAALIIKYVPHLRMIGYVLAGAAGLVAIHLIIKSVMGLSGIAPTRGFVGLVAQAIAGGVGGYLFHLLSMKRTAAD